MNTYNGQVHKMLDKFHLRRGFLFGVIIIGALIAFEIFNYSTTEFALSDLLGDLEFLGMRWATILAIAFCGIDFAGIARLFTPEPGRESGPINHNESWYLFGAGLLAATMNAMLTWWGVSLAILNHDTLGNAVVARETLLRAVPIFVAILVWLIRVLIIGTFSVAGDRLFGQDDAFASDRRRTYPKATIQPAPQHTFNSHNPAPRSVAAPNGHRGTMKASAPVDRDFVRPEPTYHSLSASSQTGRTSNATINDPGMTYRGRS
jgi:hypothetical protein